MKHFITCICLMMSIGVIAQSTKTNQTTITVDRKVDGKIIQEVFAIEGEAADVKLKELEKDQSVININVEKRVEMISDDPNNAEMQEMRKEIEVEINEMEKVTGKKAERREEMVEIEVTADDKEEIKKYKVKIIEDGKEEVIEWNGQGEMPAKMKKVMEDTEVIVKDKRSTVHKNREIEIDQKEKGNNITDEEEIILIEKNNNRGQIGVMVGSIEGGVEILSFADNSMARAAGLKEGDVITAVNNTKVVAINDLVDALSPFEPGDVVTISYTRGSRKLTKEVRLNKRN